MTPVPGPAPGLRVAPALRLASDAGDRERSSGRRARSAPVWAAALRAWRACGPGGRAHRWHTEWPRLEPGRRDARGAARRCAATRGEPNPERRAMAISIRPMRPGFAGEVTGIDITRP